MSIKIHQTIADWFGYRLVRKEKMVEVSQQPKEHLKLLLENLHINHVLDIGANTGQYAGMLREIGYEGKISSFEPVQSCFDELVKKSQEDSKWNVYHYALGKEDSRANINVSIATAFSSFLTPNDYANNRYKRIQASHTEHVEVKRLDSVFDNITTPREKVYLKLDTQGFDLQAFAGAKGCMERILGMQSEVSATAIYEGMPDYLNSLQVYQNSGFRLTGLYPIAWDEPSMRVIEFDCYMRRM